jgi:hypothetical protein
VSGPASGAPAGSRIPHPVELQVERRGPRGPP